MYVDTMCVKEKYSLYVYVGFSDNFARHPLMKLQVDC